MFVKIDFKYIVVFFFGKKKYIGSIIEFKNIVIKIKL